MLAAPTFPTPVRACPELASAHSEVWLKNDGLSHPLYGGNKVRKAERLIAEALARGARRVVSVGAAGSHHVLTLTLFARAAGLESAAVLFPQPRTEHALDTLRAALGLGLTAQPVPHAAAIPFHLARLLRRGDYFVPPGGSNAIGAAACADAVAELRTQIDAGELPVPDLIVVALGSGGTCAGLANGIVQHGLPTRVLGVQVVAGLAPRLAARYLASGREARARLGFDATRVGAGYGFATAAGDAATVTARSIGLELDPTYTAKAFAALCELARRGMPQIKKRPARLLYWHTLTATPLEPLLQSAPSEAELSIELRRLLA